MTVTHKPQAGIRDPSLQVDAGTTAEPRPQDGKHAILCVFGTRPEAIKMAPVVRALAKQTSAIRPVVCVTEQHREMLDQVLHFFAIRPDYRLGIMRENQSPSEVAARVLARLPEVLADLRPTAVLVQGDTTTTFAAALAAFYARIPVGHVEAGLRTHQRYAPFPEEVNRQMVTTLATWHFAPTESARANLLHEGVSADRIFVTGNPVIDALHWTARNLGPGTGRALPQLDGRRRILLVTAHRRESFGAPLTELCHALNDLVEQRPDIDLVYSVHPNPEVQRTVRGVLRPNDRLHLIPPLEYWHLVNLLQRSYLVLTDSGGIQEEAPSLGKPVLVMRDTTERPEGINAGTARLVGTARGRIVQETERLLDDPKAYALMARAQNPYGDGHAAKRIAKILSTAIRPTARRDSTRRAAAQ